MDNRDSDFILDLRFFNSLLGLIMAVSIPAIAFIQTSALISATVGAAIVAVAAIILLWHRRPKRPPPESERP